LAVFKDQLAPVSRILAVNHFGEMTSLLVDQSTLLVVVQIGTFERIPSGKHLFAQRSNSQSRIQ
jgi:hypothetical protein